jgi:hypothetical protein
MLLVITTWLFYTCKTIQPLYVPLGGTPPPKDADIKITAKEYLKKYALCKCIDYAYTKDSVAINDRSTSFLAEMGESLITPSVDSLVSAIAKNYVYRPRTGSMHADGGSQRLTMADCVFFSESKRVRILADSLLKGVRSLPSIWGKD